MQTWKLLKIIDDVMDMLMYQISKNMEHDTTQGIINQCVSYSNLNI